MYKVLKHFVDLTDNNHEYHTGDTFPRDGLKVTKARFTELSTDKNRRGFPLIAEIDDVVKAEEVKTEKKEPAKRGKKKNA